MAGKALLSRLSQLAGPAGAVAAGAGLLYAGSEAIFTVDSGYRAIIYSRIGGVGSTHLDEGYHFLIPWLNRPIIYEIRTRRREYRGQRTQTKDLQTVTINLMVLYKPDPTRLNELYRYVGPNEDGQEQAFDNNVMPSVVIETLKSVIAIYNADMLVTKREGVSSQIRELLENRAREYGIIIEDVAITDYAFGTSYTQAVEMKQIAQQDAQRAALYVEKAKQEKQQKIVEAEGEEAAARLIGAAVKQNPAYLNLQKIRAAVEIAQTVAQSSNRVYLNSNSLLLDVNQHTIGEGSLQSQDAETTSSSSVW